VRKLRWLLIPLVTLGTALAITWLIFDYERQSNNKEIKSQFDFALRDTVGRIEQRMASYEQMLRGVQGLFATTDEWERAPLHDYAALLPLGPSFSGVQAIGFVQYVPTAGKDAHIADMRQRKVPKYAILPEGEREVYAPVTMREPNMGRNRITLGYDTWTDPVRRLAMQTARDSGMAAISGKVRLRMDADLDAGATPGFLMFLPIYARAQAHDTVAQRRAHLVGWVYASFHMDQVIASLYGEHLPGLTFALYDGVELSESSLMYRHGDDSHDQLTASRLSANEYVVAGSHTWTLAMTALPAFGERFLGNEAQVIGITGVGLSLLLTLLAWLLTTGQARALRLAARMTRELRESEEHFRNFFDKNSSVMLLIDPALGKIVNTNMSAASFYGYSIERLSNMLISEINTLPPERIAEEINKAVLEERNYFIFKHQLASGAVRDVEVHSTPIQRAGRALLLSIVHDITERKQAEEKIQALAFFDSLTNLPNRTLLTDRLKQAMTIGHRNGTFGAVMFIDLDHFKTLNDTHGHAMGDLLLQQVARRLVACVREGDTVGRLGGDEFVVILANLSNIQAVAIAQTKAIGDKILALLNQPYQLDEVTHHSTASIGATLFMGHKTPVVDLMQQADLAMYKVKDAGRNALHFFD
jgi:diguanylate cyclase (GGDEF)-like protein/PAS domain S-box-containing protein